MQSIANISNGKLTEILHCVLDDSFIYIDSAFKIYHAEQREASLMELTEILHCVLDDSLIYIDSAFKICHAEHREESLMKTNRDPSLRSG